MTPLSISGPTYVVESAFKPLRISKQYFGPSSRSLTVCCFLVQVLLGKDEIVRVLLEKLEAGAPLNIQPVLGK